MQIGRDRRSKSFVDRYRMELGQWLVTLEGIAARIMVSNPKAVYAHSSSHALNLYVVQSTSSPDVRI